jgi:hypothetical protein
MGCLPCQGLSRRWDIVLDPFVGSGSFLFMRLTSNESHCDGCARCSAKEGYDLSP